MLNILYKGADAFHRCLYTLYSSMEVPLQNVKHKSGKYILIYILCCIYTLISNLMENIGLYQVMVNNPI